MPRDTKQATRPGVFDRISNALAGQPTPGASARGSSPYRGDTQIQMTPEQQRIYAQLRAASQAFAASPEGQRAAAAEARRRGQ